ncbi:cell division control protein 45 [Monosporozyma servazzii]
MYYGLKDYGKAYNEIIGTAASPSSCHLCIFVSCLNIDALCATKMLSTLFKKQLVQLQIVPIFGYAELKWHYDQIRENSTMNSIILVGFGGFIDIESFLNIDPQEFIIEDDGGTTTTENEVKYSRNFYILDSHRPWNLDNLFGSNMIKCLDDGSVEDDSLTAVKNAYQQLLLLEDKEGNESDVSNSDEEGETEQDGEITDEDENEDVYINVNNKRSNPNGNNEVKDLSTMSRKQRRKEIHLYETTLEEYYSQGTTLVNSISSQVYSLLSAIGETNLQQLWLTILGATSLDTEYTAIYQRLFPILQDEVKRLSPGGSNTSNVGQNSALKNADTLALELQPDYYLFLLRYSSLYDSFYYSNYVNAKLSLWNENGKKRLHKMFARMGIPLNVAKESWIYMDNSIKRQLPTILDRNLDKYGLQDILRDGFVKTFGYRGMISASEFVEALNALLEVGQVNPTEVSGNNNNDNEENPDADDVENTTGNENKLERKKWVSNFWLSWDALDTNKIDILKRGIEHAKYLQRSIFDTGVTVLEKKLIKHLRIYRLCVLQDGPDLALYENPLTLLRLGNWLIECCSETEEKQLLPLVLASLNEATETYLVAGLSPRYPRGLDIATVKKPILNNFSMAFQQIAEQTGAQVRIDNFESSIIEVQREDLSPFLEKLTLSGLL